MRDLVILKVDLTKRKVDSFIVKAEVAMQYLGGSGLGIYLLDNSDGTAESLSSESSFGIFPGLLTGSPVPCASKTSFCSRSPLTGIWGEATVGRIFRWRS